MKLYLDYNASTPLDTCVLDAMTEFLSGMVGNPSSTHQFGRAVCARLDTAHTRRLRDCLGAGLLRYSEISVFASHAERLPNTVQLAISGIDGDEGGCRIGPRCHTHQPWRGHPGSAYRYFAGGPGAAGEMVTERQPGGWLVRRF